MTKLLLDTQAALFWWAGSSKLTDAVRVAVDRADTVFVSTATAWEVATKFRIGKLPFVGDPEIHMPRLMDEHRFAFLPIEARHSLRAGALPGDHRDPFDRIIAAQALIEGLTIVTRDREIAAFGCKVLW